MSTQDNDGQQRFALGLVFALVLLAVAMVLGVGIGQRNPLNKPVVGTAASVARPQDPSPALLGVLSPPVLVAVTTDTSAAADAASIRVEQGLVKFYFASGKADVAPGAALALAGMAEAARAGRQLRVSGFHDATGDVAKNAELAEQRARAVQAVLIAAGVPQARIELKKPQQMAGSGSDAEARRVEISVQ